MRNWILPLGLGLGTTTFLALLAVGCDGGEEDPVERNCSDEVDNDNDGVTDCDDPDCAATLACDDGGTDDTDDTGETDDTGSDLLPILGDTAEATITGEDEETWTGFSMAGGQDINGDGTPDVIVGAPRMTCQDGNGNEMSASGAAYVFFGPVSGDLSASNADITICGARPDAQLGSWVGLSPDLTGDGAADIVVSAPRERSGRVFVFSGLEPSSERYLADPGAEGTPVAVDIVGEGSEFHFGDTFTVADPARGETLPKLVVGADAWSDQSSGSAGANLGRTYIFESLEIPEGESQLQIRASRADSWWTGATAGEDSGRSVAVADFNGDGDDDLAIGALGTSFDGAPNGGAVYVIWGNYAGSRSSLDEADAVLQSRVSEEGVGQVVRSAGDYNDDGITDMIVGAHKASSNSGVSYIWFGTNAGWTTSDTGAVEVALRGVSANDNAGHSVDGLGDVTGDGIDDVLIGSINVSAQGSSQRGAAYIIAGDSFTGAADLDQAAWATYLGTAAEEVAGHRVAGVGDMNGDSTPDMLIGAYRADDLTGAVYLLAGPIAEQ